MISKSQVRYVQSLRMSKFRKEHGAFIAEGEKLAEELLQSGFGIRQLFALPDWIQRNQNRLDTLKISAQEVSEAELGRISGLVTPNKVLAVVAIPQGLPQADLGEHPLVLVLDRIQDPGNLGTMIRTADWFGIGQVFCSEGTADLYNPKVVQSTMGSICRVRVSYGMMGEVLGMLKAQRYTIYGAMTGGESVYDIPASFPAALLIGNESQGISHELHSLLDHQVGIPQVSSGAESLNAAVAAGILCSEFARRKAR